MAGLQGTSDDGATGKDLTIVLKGKEESQEATSAAQTERAKLKDELVTVQFSQSESRIVGATVVQQCKVVKRFFLWERRRA